MANIDQKFHPQGSQMYVFKVIDINCCEDCPKKLERALKKLSGIESVEVDATQCLATVKALIDSSEIIDKIKKWGKKAELVHDGPKGEEEGLFNPSCGHQDSSSRHKNSSFRRKYSFFCKRDKSKGGRSHAPEKDNSESKAPSSKEIPDHICRDPYCTIHRRDGSGMSNHLPNINYGTSYSPFYCGGGGNYNYPRMNSYVPPPPLRYGQYYGPGMFAPMAGYGSYATQRQMPRRSRPDGYASYFSDEYSNGCNNM